MAIDFGPLTSLINDHETTEIMVNAHDNIFVERAGVVSAVPLRFVDLRALEEMVQSLLYHSGKDVTSALRFDGTLPNGARFNVTLPPLSPKGPTLTIRKHMPSYSTLEMLVQKKSLSPKAAAFLSACVRGRMNILVSGGTGTGKTTLLNALASYINPQERLVTIEDTAELQIRHPNCVTLVSVKDGKTPTSIREALRNALRMRPDRILVGECRGPEAADMMQAMNTGHEGSLSTIHANTSVDALARLESLILEGSGDIPVKALRRNISQALDLVVQLKRGRNGQRYVSEITEVCGLEGDVITRATIFQTPENASNGDELKSTGIVPGFLKRLEARDVKLAPRFFDPNVNSGF